jgi:ribosomal protein S18 acetylase RimI-like enzyme
MPVASSSLQSERAHVIAALEGNLLALWTRFGRGDGCVLYQRNDAVWFDTPARTLPYNAVLRFAVDRDVDARIDALFDHYHRRGVPFLWMVHPTARPDDLAGRLRARGMEEAEVCPGMWMHLRDLGDTGDPPPGVVIREVRDAGTAAGLFELIAWRWELSPSEVPLLPGITRAFDVGRPGSAVRCWVAWREAAPVAKVVMNLAAGAAGIYGVATKPNARGLGLARLLTLHALHTARRDGYELGVLHATPMAQPMYERIGFRVEAPFGIFAPPHTLHV